MGAKAFGIGMSGDNRLGACFNNAPETCCGNVGNIYQHTQAVHFRYNLFAEKSQPAAGGFFVNAVGNVVAVAPGKRHGTHAKFVQAAQRFQAAVNGAAFFNGKQGCRFVFQYIACVFGGTHLQHINAVFVQFFYFLVVFIKQAQGITQAALIAENFGRYINSAELQAAAKGNLAFNIKVLFVFVQRSVFIVEFG